MVNSIFDNCLNEYLIGCLNFGERGPYRVVCRKVSLINCFFNVELQDSVALSVTGPVLTGKR